MKTFFTLLMIFVFVLGFTDCQSKKETPEPIVGTPVIVTDDPAPVVDVDAPKADWRNSVAVIADASPLSGIARESALDALGKSGYLRVATSDAVKESRYVLKTSVTEVDDRYRVQSELIDTEADTVMMLSQQEASGPQVLEVTEQMMRRAAEAVTGGPSDATAPGRDVAPQAMSLYLDARRWMAQGNHDATNQAVALLKQSLTIQEDFIDAWDALAQSYLAIIESGWDRNLIWLKLARQSALKIREIDPAHAKAQLILGQVALREGDYMNAETCFRNALDRNSSLKEAWYGLGVIFGSYGLYSPALEMYEQALTLDPLMKSASVNRGLILSGMRQYTQSQSVFQSLLQQSPGDGDLHVFLAIQYFYAGNLNEALRAVETGLQSTSMAPLAHAVKAMILAKQGDADAAFGLVEMEVKPQVGGNASLAVAAAAIYALIGRKGQAIQWIEKAVDLGYKEYPWLKSDPNFASLMEDPRMEAVLEKLKAAWEGRMEAYVASRP